MGISSLWGSMSRSMSGTRESEKDKYKDTGSPRLSGDSERKVPPTLPAKNLAKRLPPAPPVHPSSPRAATFGTHEGPPLPARNKDRPANAHSRSVSWEDVPKASEATDDEPAALDPESETVEENPEAEAEAEHSDASDAEKSIEQPSDTLTISPPEPISRP